MKRMAVVTGVLIGVLGGGGAWMVMQHRQEQEQAKAAEVKRLADEAKAKADAEAAQKAAEEASKPRRVTDPPLAGAEGTHFSFSHHVGDRVGYEYQSQKRPALHEHLVCNDGVIQAMTFDYGWLDPRSTSYDFYKVPVASKGWDQICLSLRNEDVTTFKTILATRKPSCDAMAEGSSCELTLPTKDCSDADKAAIRSQAGRDKDVVHWCQIQSAGERFGVLQAVTQRDKICEINSWLVDGGKLRAMEGLYSGTFKVPEGSKEPATCMFPLADGDFPEKEMTDNGGPMSPKLIFELGQKTYLVEESSGSEGYTSTLYRLSDDKLEKVVDYYNYVIDHNFWKSTGEPDPKASEADGGAQ